MRPESLLVVKTSSLGDVVHMLPAVTDVRRCFPRIRIDWVVEESFADIPKLHPGVEYVIALALRRWRKRLWRPSVIREIKMCRRALRQHEYDVVLDSQGLIKSAVIARMANGPAYGPDKNSAREPYAARFYQHVFCVPKGQHAIIRNRNLTAQAFGYPLSNTPPDYGVVPPAQPGLALPKRYVVCLHGTSDDAKLWRNQHWVMLGKALAANRLVALFPWDNEHEQRRARTLAAEIPSARILPRLAVKDIVGVLNGACAAVGVDTGLVHLAAALGRPTVAIFVGTAPGLTGVVGQNPALAVNLGDRGAMPAPLEVLHQLKRMRVI